MSYDLTVGDKNQPVDLVIDGEWHPFTIGGQTMFRPDVPDPSRPATYIVFPELNGRILTLPASNIERRGDRYPPDSADGSTAWDSIDIFHTVAKGRWYGGGVPFKVTINPIGHPDGSTHIGLSYRVRQNPKSETPGRLTNDDRILKFVFVPDSAVLR